MVQARSGRTFLGVGLGWGASGPRRGPLPRPGATYFPGGSSSSANSAEALQPVGLAERWFVGGWAGQTLLANRLKWIRWRGEMVRARTVQAPLIVRRDGPSPFVRLRGHGAGGFVAWRVTAVGWVNPTGESRRSGAWVALRGGGGKVALVERLLRSLRHAPCAPVCPGVPSS